MAGQERLRPSRVLAALWAVFLWVVIAGPATAQQVPCGDGAGIIAHLEKEWGEDPAVVALDAAGRMVRILANPETGTWSMLVTRPGRDTCLIGSGTAWEPIDPPPSTGSGPGDPS